MIDQIQNESPDQTKAPFKFIISPKVTSGVDVRIIALYYRDEVFKKIQSYNFTSLAKAIIFFPRIFNPFVRPLPDRITYKKGDRSIYVGRSIPYDTWMISSIKDRSELFRENLCESLAIIPSKYLTDDDRKEIFIAINEACEVIRLRLLH